jgi:hypothetical protein
MTTSPASSISRSDYFRQEILKRWKPELNCEGVREYMGEDIVNLKTLDNGILVIEAINEGGHNSTEVDLLQLIQWLKINRPELLQ